MYLIILILSILFNSAIFADTAAQNGPNDWIQRLQNAGWTQTAARAVITVNQKWFTDLAQHDQLKFNGIMRDLGFLASFPNWINFLERRPEAAGLAINAENPEQLYKVLTATSQQCWPAILQQYSYLSTPLYAAQLTKALEAHQARICQLAQAGVPGAALIFLVAENSPEAREYFRWLDQSLIEPALLATQRGYDKAKANGDLAVAVTFAVTQGPGILRRMETDPIFCQRFNQLWDALDRAIGDPELKSQKLTLITAQPQIWDLLLLDQGEAILKAWGPIVPVALLFGPNALPKDLHPMAINALFQQHSTVVSLLFNHLGEQDLYSLIRRRDLDRYQVEKVLNALEGPCPACPQAYSDRLTYFRNLTPTAIEHQFAPPASGIVAWIPFHNEAATISKIVDGRRTTTLELAFLALSLVHDAFSLGKIGAVASSILVPDSSSLFATTDISSVVGSILAPDRASSLTATTVNTAASISASQWLMQHAQGGIETAVNIANGVAIHALPVVQKMCEYSGFVRNATSGAKIGSQLIRVTPGVGTAMNVVTGADIAVDMLCKYVALWPGN